MLVETRSVTPAAPQAMRRVLDQKNQLGALENQITSRPHEVESITKDQAWLREIMKALKGSSEERALLQRYTRQLDQQEDRLFALPKEISDLDERKDKADEDLEQTIQAIVIDESL
jgi:chromosome segregation ATPase